MKYVSEINRSTRTIFGMRHSKFRRDLETFLIENNICILILFMADVCDWLFFVQLFFVFCQFGGDEFLCSEMIHLLMMYYFPDLCRTCKTEKHQPINWLGMTSAAFVIIIDLLIVTINYQKQILRFAEVESHTKCETNALKCFLAYFTASLWVASEMKIIEENFKTGDSTR